jgi:hypothetical protein
VIFAADFKGSLVYSKHFTDANPVNCLGVIRSCLQLLGKILLIRVFLSIFSYQRKYFSDFVDVIGKFKERLWQPNHQSLASNSARSLLAASFQHVFRKILALRAG